MQTESKQSFIVLVHPKEILIDYMKENNMTIGELHEQMTCSMDELEQLLLHAAPITPTIAAGLDKATGIRASFWLRAQTMYEAYLDRVQQKSLKSSPE